MVGTFEELLCELDDLLEPRLAPSPVTAALALTRVERFQHD
jgi:hypothetical protein